MGWEDFLKVSITFYFIIIKLRCGVAIETQTYSHHVWMLDVSL